MRKIFCGLFLSLTLLVCTVYAEDQTLYTLDELGITLSVPDLSLIHISTMRTARSWASWPSETERLRQDHSRRHPRRQRRRMEPKELWS